MAILGFGSEVTRRFFQTGELDRKAGWFRLSKVVARKLDMVHYASSLRDLLSPPANRLESLKGDLKGFHSIRVNDQWRVIFRWTN
ncbi:MAG: type II toxin-antitoxin system RelE/ParE family toxin, partial [Myxococcota bacterium]